MVAVSGFSDEDSQPQKSETVKDISKGRGTVVKNRNKDEGEMFEESEGLPGNGALSHISYSHLELWKITEAMKYLCEVLDHSRI